MIGEVVSGRFRVEERVGSGGMGTVYRATDEVTHSSVAFKVLNDGVLEGLARFGREIAALSRVSHPSIVRYIAHGPNWVAMEWVEGEDLARRLFRGPLAVGEAIDLVAHLADALEHVHALGIVHRDIKPGNILFEGGDIARARIVDFGLAWIRDDDSFRSLPGSLLGTPGYMSPEQIRAVPVDARSDVFALGCLLYHAITGRPPFKGSDAVATLAKILFDDPKPPSSIRHGIPFALDGLLARALAKHAAHRQASAAAFAAELRRLDRTARDDVPETMPPPVATGPTLTDRERRILSVVVAARGGLGADVSALRREADTEFVKHEAAIRDIAHRHGARLDILPVAIVAVLGSQGSATDSAASAARLSLALRALLSGVPIALATGRAEVGSRSVGDVIDRAVARVTAGHASTDAVWLDDTTAGLLGPAFVVRGAESGIELTGERPTDMRVRTLLGKPTPCVGRDRDLAFLDATLAECEADEIARAVVVTAPAGVGKSRLRHEWLQRLAGAGRNVEVWTARADPMTMGAPFSLLAKLVRRAAAIDPAEPDDAARRRLRARVSRHVDDFAVAQRIAEFLGEMAGVRFDDEGRVQLRAARQDPQLMGDQMRRAWEDWVGVETREATIVIVVEDLHWGDLPSVRLIDYALGAHANRPLMVVALARPEVSEVFPGLWKAHKPLALELADLGAKASARLVRHVFGDAIPEETVDRIVAEAAGNAFFLEEIIRAVAEGRGADVPETVLAMVQRRLDALEPEARRVMRAASVFGEAFWRSAVLEQVGAVPGSVSRIDDQLTDLAARELVTVRAESRFADEQELTFRHALVREAAYAMLVDDDRALAHRLAGAWLEAHGERDAAVLASHFDRGGNAPRAVQHYVRATAQAMEGSDLTRALAHVDRGAALGASGPLLGELRRLQAEALRWRGRIADCEIAAREAAELLPRGVSSWLAAVAELATAAGALGHVDVLLEARSALLAHGDASSGDFLIALARVIMQLYVAGERTLADETMSRIDAQQGVHPNPIAAARMEQARAFRALYSSDHGTYYERMKLARAFFDLAGDRRNACVMAANMGYVAVALGAIDEAEETLVSMLGVAEALGVVRIHALFQQNVGLLRHLQGRNDEAIALETKAAETFEQQGDVRLGTFSRIYLSMALAAKGDSEAAFREADRAVTFGTPLLPVRASALANLADLELRAGRVESAVGHAGEAYAVMVELGGLEDSESLVRVVYAEALAAGGSTDEALDTVRRAVESIEERAKKIAVDRWRESFKRTPENQRTFDLAARLGA
jgi:tetratricopeptide (TPR) repeat protein